MKDVLSYPIYILSKRAKGNGNEFKGDVVGE